jgi:hypothetical protein
MRRREFIAGLGGARGRSRTEILRLRSARSYSHAETHLGGLALLALAGALLFQGDARRKLHRQRRLPRRPLLQAATVVSSDGVVMSTSICKPKHQPQPDFYNRLIFYSSASSAGLPSPLWE